MKKMLIYIMCATTLLYSILMVFVMFGVGNDNEFSKSAQERAKVKIMAPIIHESQKEAFNFIVSDKISDDAEFIVDYYAIDDYFEKIEVSLSSGMYSDIIILPASCFDSSILSNEHIIPISNIMDEDKIDELDITRNFFRKLYYGNEQKAISYDIFASSVFYNKSIFDKCGIEFPTNFEELKNVISVLRKNDIIPFAVNCDGAGTYLFDYVLSDVLEKTSDISENDYSQLLKKLGELNELGAFPSEFYKLDNYETRSLFIDGKAAMIVEDTSFCLSMSEIYNAKKGEGAQFGMSFFPWLGRNIGNEKRLLYGMGNYIIMFTDKIMQEPARLKMVSDFINHIFDEDVANSFFSETYGISTIKTLRPRSYSFSLMMDCFNLIDNAQLYVSFLKNDEKKFLNQKITDYFFNTDYSAISSTDLGEDKK